MSDQNGVDSKIHALLICCGPAPTFVKNLLQLVLAQVFRNNALETWACSSAGRAPALTFLNICCSQHCTNLFSTKFGAVAQLGEHLLCKQRVRSSSLLSSIDPEKGSAVPTTAEKLRKVGAALQAGGQEFDSPQVHKIMS